MFPSHFPAWRVVHQILPMPYWSQNSKKTNPASILMASEDSVEGRPPKSAAKPTLLRQEQQAIIEIVLDWEIVLNKQQVGLGIDCLKQNI